MDMEKIRPAWVEVDLDKIANNMREIRRLTNKKAEITAVIKANAYGHGSCVLAPILAKNGANRFAVAELAKTYYIKCPLK